MRKGRLIIQTSVRFEKSQCTWIFFLEAACFPGKSMSLKQVVHTLLLLLWVWESACFTHIYQRRRMQMAWSPIKTENVSSLSHPQFDVVSSHCHHREWRFRFCCIAASLKQSVVMSTPPQSKQTINDKKLCWSLRDIANFKNQSDQSR